MSSDLNPLRAQVFKALSHPIRLEMVEWLAERGEACVCEMVDRFELSQSSISKHLALLTANGVLGRRQEGLRVYYRVKIPCVLQALACIDRVLLAGLEERKRQLEGANRRVERN